MGRIEVQLNLNEQTNEQNIATTSQITEDCIHGRVPSVT